MFFSTDTIEIIDRIANRIGFASMTTAVGINAAEAQEMVDIASSGTAQTAIIVSIVGGVLFIIEKLLVIYLRWVNRKDKID